MNKPHICIFGMMLFLSSCFPFFSLISNPGDEKYSGVTLSTSQSGINYTTFTYSNNALDQFRPEEMVQQLNAMYNDTVSSIDNAYYGMSRFKNLYSPSLFVTLDVLRAYLDAGRTISDTSKLISWVYSCLDPGGDHFCDPFSEGWRVIPDNGGYALASPYSPVVATSCALEILEKLGIAVNISLANAIETYLLACFNSSVGGFNGNISGSLPTIVDTCFAVKALYRIGKLGNLDYGPITGFLSSFQQQDGLIYHATPSLYFDQTQFSSHLQGNSRIVVETLDILNRLSDINLAQLKDGLKNYYNNTSNYFSGYTSFNEYEMVATVETVNIFEIIGYPSSFNKSVELPLISAWFGQSQSDLGGWSKSLGEDLCSISLISRIISLFSSNPYMDCGEINMDYAFAMVTRGAIVGSDFKGYAEIPSDFPDWLGFSKLVELYDIANRVEKIPESFYLTHLSSALKENPYFPQLYPDMAERDLKDVSIFHNFFGGVYSVEQIIRVKHVLGIPFKSTDLVEYKHALMGLQCIDSDQGIPSDLVGWCIKESYFKDIINLIPGIRYSAISLETTAALVRSLELLRQYDSSMFNATDFLNVNTLFEKIAHLKYSTSDHQWFERSGTMAYQAEGNSIDNLKLRDTRWIIEIIEGLKGASNPYIQGWYHPVDIIQFVKDTTLKSTRDVFNAVRILEILDAPISSEKASWLLPVLSAIRDPISGFFTRDGSPSFLATMEALAVLSKFSAPRVRIDNVVDIFTQNNTILAGKNIPVMVEDVNLFHGPEDHVAYTLSIPAVSIHATSNQPAIKMKIPLHVENLGECNMSIVLVGDMVENEVQIPLHIISLLKIGDGTSKLSLKTTQTKP